MPKYPKNKKGKQPLRTRRGPDGRWIPPLPDPEPPDDHDDQGASVRARETPVTAGGLAIRELQGQEGNVVGVEYYRGRRGMGWCGFPLIGTRIIAFGR